VYNWHYHAPAFTAGKSNQALTDEERQMLEEAVEANFLFANMNDTERATVFEAMQKVPVKVSLEEG
jgi:hypothetical protein